MEQTRTLYRPVGLKELELILESGSLRFPPRLPEQPIFYPVLLQEYAEQIAREWNAPDPSAGHAGYVTVFDVRVPYVDQFGEQVVGSRKHRELWVPAEQLDEFNDNIVGGIRLRCAFFGEGYRGPAAERGELVGLDGLALPARLLACLEADTLKHEVEANWQAVVPSYLYWRQANARTLGLSDEDLQRFLKALEQFGGELPGPKWPFSGVEG